MKATKRIFSVFLTCVLAFTMAFAMGLTASAADYTITINKPAGDIDRTYEAYQIFQGNLDGNTLSDIEWGTGIDGAAFLTELKKNASFTSCTDAKTVAEKLAAFTNDSDEAVAFAKLAGKFLTTATATSSSGKITVPAGYYLLKDVTTVTDDALSLNILKVVKDVTVNPKADHPTVDKKIGTDISTGVAANEATIGDKVPFVIASKVPQMQGYTKYFFVLNDSMTAGLTYNKDVAIKIGTTTLAADAYDVTYDDTANTMKIVIKDFIQYKSEAGKDIVVTYSATLNEKADLTQAGNKNTVKLTYSNNPNVDYKGDNEPDTTDPVGVTPEHVTVTYSTKLQLTKVDGADHNVKLEGVEFQITGTSIKTAVSKGEYFKQDAAGTYYQLKDGTFTETDPTAETESKYVSTSVKYAKVTDTTEQTKMQKVTASGTTDANGLITFEGLGAGTYYITELKTLGGYNLLTAPITVTITATPSETGCGWTVSSNATFEDDMVKLTVENNKGSVLPITGGIGTTIFYVIGGLLVCGAAVMAITKKKLSVEDKADQN
ncbi:isopeptide-forming domain-containing fimbrial protein [Ruminococcus champanellensis]|uniref:Cna protein B-type domain n=1 Tax=Ruminococcus champanellensis (strain DSM 18848 / JCM 17042 / KCTC 15320 / 18P13) TaxID=213810 RepID=D4LAX2_RUMC1|nr:isopeptide-forming domain-containing fimbrial protein [Ruminococcus champanellensis]CBL16767.1 Cna protein B-type domain [Ruminococcus champanellensis 18P13 = JCM 17042]